MYCIKCGQKLPDDAVFCTKCGTKTNGPAPVAPPETVNQLPPVPTILPEYQNQDTEAKSGKSVIADILLFFVVAAGLLAYLYSSPIARGDFFARVKLFRGEPVKVEKNLLVYQKEESDADIIVDLYEYPDVAIITEPEKNSYGLNRVLGFVPVGSYGIIDMDALGRAFLGNLFETLKSQHEIKSKIPEDDEINKMIMLGSPLQTNIKIPLKPAIGAAGSGAKAGLNDKSKKEGTANQPAVTQNPADSNSSVVSPQSPEEHYPGSDVFPPGSMRGRITGTDVNMRLGPGRDKKVIGSFDKGEVVVEIDVEMSKDAWIQVRRKNGDIGWVNADYCELVKDPKINYPKYINAVEVLYDYHEAITKKDYKKAYNLLAPEEQKISAPPDQFGRGYSNVISSTVMETNPGSTDGNTVSVEYLLEAKDKTPSGISVKYYKAFADLHRINGEWKIGKTSVGRGNLDRKTLLK